MEGQPLLLLLASPSASSSTSGSSDTTISTPRLIVVELRAIVLLWGRIVFGYYNAPEKSGSGADFAREGK